MIASIPVFIAVTLIIAGGCAFMTGHAASSAWRPLRHVVAYAFLLGGADRFIAFSLFGQDLLSLPAYLTDTAVLTVIAAGAWRATRARRMALQYPWLYERDGLFGWQDRITPHS
jgi:hypothetical protein